MKLSNMNLSKFNIKKLSVATGIALSSLALVACGGGSSSDKKEPVAKSDTIDNTGKPNPAKSDLKVAKDFIRTAKLFVLDARVVKDVYENAADVISDQQIERLNTAINVPEEIKSYMQKKGLSKFTFADVTGFNESQDGRLVLTHRDKFNITLDADDTLKMTGSFVVKQTEFYINSSWDGVNSKWVHKKFIENMDEFAVVYKNFVDDSISTVNSKKVDLSFGFDSMVIGTGSEKLTVTAKEKSLRLLGTMSSKIVADDDFDIDDAHKKGITLQKGTLSLSDVTIATASNTIDVNKIELFMLDMMNKDKRVRSIPYHFALDGNLKMSAPKTDVKITLDLTAKNSDVKSRLQVTKNGKVEEKTGKYLPMTAKLGLKGDVTKKTGSVIPLDFTANLKRNSSTSIKLESLVAKVEGKTLKVTGNTVFDKNKKEAKGSTFVLSQGKASATIKLDKNNDIIAKANGKVSDVMVNGKDYGDIFDTGSMFKTKFSDDKFIVF